MFSCYFLVLDRVYEGGVPLHSYVYQIVDRYPHHKPEILPIPNSQFITSAFPFNSNFHFLAENCVKFLLHGIVEMTNRQDCNSEL